MKGFSTLVMALSGLAIAPFGVYLVERFIPGAPSWFPFVVILLIGLTVYAVGIRDLQVSAAALIIGVTAFGILLAWAPRVLRYFPTDVQDVPPPF